MMRHLTFQSRGVLAASVLFGACLLLLPASAMAQASPPPPPAAAAAPAPPGPDSRVEVRIKSLHARLRITPAEEPQWQAFAAVMRDDAKTTGALVEARVAKLNTMTAVDDLNSYAAIAAAHAAGVQKLATAFEPLYAAMPDAQKKRADAVFRARPQRPPPPKKPG